MEAEEITRLVDGIYKNILDKFNPGARQMINAGKAYLKALHGAAAASRLYVDAISKLAKQAQQGTWGGSSDIGSALLQVVEVYKEIQAQQMNILKAFYVDLLVPLETNLEKDTKVVQSEQKKFLQQHKIRSESYSKAAANMKKYRKKGNKSSGKTGSAMDKELKNMQILEEEKSKLDMFCEQSLKNALTQERRRYGFVLERQCSLAKHYLAHHSAGVASYVRHLEDWQETARTREYIPEAVDTMFTAKLRQLRYWQDEETASSRVNNTDEDGVSVASQLRKTKSMDASCLDVRSINDVSIALKPLSRAKSEFNLNSSTHSLVQAEEPTSPQRPKSMALPDKANWETPLAKALYAYLSSGDNQLSFLEGDVIALAGDRNKGWQFGENLRTQCSGWFPLAYTEPLNDETAICSPSHQRLESISSTATTPVSPGMNVANHIHKPQSTTLFGDTIVQRRLIKQNSRKPIMSNYPNLGPPPSLPAPVPDVSKQNQRSITSPGAVHSPSQTMMSQRGDAATLPGKRRTVHPPPMPPLPLHLGGKRANGTPGSLHSSNDSGFSNDPPPQPEVDYSDDDSARMQQMVRSVTSNGVGDPGKKELMSSVRGWLLYKSALDLWDDVNEQSNGKHLAVSRTLSVRQNLENGGTLGRFNSHDMLKTTPVAIDKVAETPRITVKRAKSLWKFKRANKNEILEGMSLWKHRSLIDVRTLNDEDEVNVSKANDEKETYGSTDALIDKEKEKQKKMEKRNNEKNMRSIQPKKSETPEEEEEEEEDDDEEENYFSDENFGDDGSDSIIVVNDHVNLTVRRKNGGKYSKNTNSSSNDNTTLKASNRSDISQSNTYQEKCKSEVSNSRSELSEDTDTETIRKESFLPRMKLMKSSSNDLVSHYIERDGRQKEFQTWNVNSKVKEIKKWQDEVDGTNYYKEKANNKLKDNPKVFQEQLRITDNKTKCGPWYDLWPADAPVKS